MSAPAFEHDIVPACGEPTWRVDVGGGRELLAYADGLYRFAHVCDRGSRGVIRCAPLLQPEHHVTEQGPTVTPSILCPDCGTHGFVTDGQWVA